MTFVKSISSCYRNYFNIKGKASRSEYWWFQLYGVIVGLILAFIFMPFITNLEVYDGFVVLVLLQLLYSLISFFIVFIPGLTCEIRRLADGGHSRWLVLLRLVSFLAIIPSLISIILISIISIVYLILLIEPSKEVNVANLQLDQ